jgi:hypothetical protein
MQNSQNKSRAPSLMTSAALDGSIGHVDVDGALVVGPARACKILNTGMTRLYELLAARELESYRDGSRRQITVKSIQNYIDRQLSMDSTVVFADVTAATTARHQRRTEGEEASTI